jgi:hypothetical protein
MHSSAHYEAYFPDEAFYNQEEVEKDIDNNDRYKRPAHEFVHFLRSHPISKAEQMQCAHGDTELVKKLKAVEPLDLEWLHLTKVNHRKEVQESETDDLECRVLNCVEGKTHVDQPSENEDEIVAEVPLALLADITV